MLSLATITTPQNNGNVECTSGTLYKDWVSTSLSLIPAEHQKTLHRRDASCTPLASAAEGPARPTLEDLLAQGHDLRELFGYTIDETRVASGSGGEAVCCVSGTTVGKH